MTDDQPDDQTIDQPDAQPPPDTPRRMATRMIGLAMIIGSLVLATYLIVAAVAWFSEQGLTSQGTSPQYSDEINHQMTLATEDLAAGSASLALRRLEWILEQEPGHPGALSLQTQVEAILKATAAAPVVFDSDDSVDIATETPTEPAPDDRREDVLPELQSLRRLVARQHWEAVLPVLLVFRQEHPDYERLETDQLLYDTYLNLGLETIEGDKVELGLNYLGQAENLGTLPAEAQDYYIWANLYLDGIAYYGVNWAIAESYFRDLCASAPFFQSSCQKLNEILLNQAQLFAFAGDWCPASEYYEELWRSQGGAEIEARLVEARENCALSTPVPLTDTIGVTTTIQITPDGAGE